jgi:Xaa-Pro aminopeptidase
MQQQERLFALRSAMSAFGIDAYIVPSADPHLGEYVADHWKFREWLSSFNGSAGTLVVTDEVAALWTDSRYFLQAEQQLNGTGIELIKMGLPHSPSIEQWLVDQLLPGNTVGVDGRLFSIDEIRQFMREFKKNNLLFDTHKTLIDEVWDTRPAIPEEPLFEHSKKIAGFGRRQKLDIIRREMEAVQATHYITTALDEIAWALNLRGSDVMSNPVFHSYLVVDEEGAHLFVDPHKLKASIGKSLAEDDIKPSRYDDFYIHLKELFTPGSSVFFDPKRTNGAVLTALPSNIAKVEGPSIITNLKAVKNQAEISAIEKAMLKDGVAMVQFLHWLDVNVGKEPMTETTVARKCRWFRSQQEGFWGESFEPIPGYAANGAIVHYSAKDDTAASIEPRGFLLFDSGGQYPEGTTDLTRTICLGEISEQAKIDYTLVLKGHIALASAIFPQGTKGIQLDTLARLPLWQSGMNYGHGTGHGVGCFLNVHEGPHSISPRDNTFAIIEGMLSSNEPALYRTGQYGIRTENLMLAEPHCTTEFGSFMKFRTVTLCPIDTRPILVEMLTSDERDWINNYHRDVLQKLSPLLAPDVQEWLVAQTQPI